VIRAGFVPLSRRHPTVVLAGRMAGNLHFLPSGGKTMLLALAVILAVAWLLGFSVFHVASAAIHILIVLAVISLIVYFIQGRGVGGRGTLTT
jgi:hypothetical protein